MIGKKDRPEVDPKDRPATGTGNLRPDVTVEGDVNIGGNRTRVNYQDNQKAWVDNRHATGNQVRANSGNRYAGAYTSAPTVAASPAAMPTTAGGRAAGATTGGRAPTYAGLGAFLGVAAIAAKPTYLAYGDGGNVYYEGDNVVINGAVAGTAEEYARQAQALVAARRLRKRPRMPSGCRWRLRGHPRGRGGFASHDRAGDLQAGGAGRDLF